MLRNFKNLTKKEQYQIIHEYIKKIELECIELKEALNQNLSKENREYRKNVITKVNMFPATIDVVTDLICTSKLSNDFKKILLKEITDNIKIINKIKTR